MFIPVRTREVLIYTQPAYIQHETALAEELFRNIHSIEASPDSHCLVIFASDFGMETDKNEILFQMC